MTDLTRKEVDIETLVAGLSTRLIEESLADTTQEELLNIYCNTLAQAGLALHRVHVAQRALHPVLGGIGFNWVRGDGVSGEQYERTEVPRREWELSPFYMMISERQLEFRQHLPEPQAMARYPILEELHAQGATDYFAVVMAFGGIDMETHQLDPNDPHEGIIISWTSAAPGGFSDSDLNMLQRLMPPLGLSLKSISMRSTANDLMSIYLGGDAGRRVLSGVIQRGSLEVIHAVIWYFDLRGFTRLSESHPGKVIIAMLNDYFGAVGRILEAHDGQILKFMGDGLLASFNHSDERAACRAALDAAAALSTAMDEVRVRREADGLPFPGFSLAIHAGEVMYGNIGAENRLDFTIIGPAVNETARMLAMCGQLEREVIVSARVAANTARAGDELVSLGRYMLRGVVKPTELFTLGPPAP